MLVSLPPETLEWTFPMKMRKRVTLLERKTDAGQRARAFSPAFKEAAVRRISAGEKVRALAAEPQVWPKLLYHWASTSGARLSRCCHRAGREDRQSRRSERGSRRVRRRARGREKSTAAVQVTWPSPSVSPSWNARSASRRWSSIFSLGVCQRGSHGSTRAGTWWASLSEVEVPPHRRPPTHSRHAGLRLQATGAARCLRPQA